jgi:hypothetical protein
VVVVLDQLAREQGLLVKETKAALGIMAVVMLMLVVVVVERALLVLLVLRVKTERVVLVQRHLYQEFLLITLVVVAAVDGELPVQQRVLAVTEVVVLAE